MTCGNHSRIHLDQPRRIKIAIIGYDAGKEAKRLSDKYKRRRDGEKEKQVQATKAARHRQEIIDAATDIALAELNNWLQSPPKTDGLPSTQTEGKTPCNFL